MDVTKGVESVEQALAGARDIIAERVSDDATARAKLRALFWGKAVVRSNVASGKEEEGAKFKDYFDWSEPVGTIPSHRLLAIRRGEAEGFLRVRIKPPEEDALALLEPLFVKGKGPAAEQVRLAVQDSYKRLLSAAIEAEIRLESKKKADAEAIRVFFEQPARTAAGPAAGAQERAGDRPGFPHRLQGRLPGPPGEAAPPRCHLSHRHRTPPQPRSGRDCPGAAAEDSRLKPSPSATAPPAAKPKLFIRALKLPTAIPIVMVNESGASIYSASEVAREEFPDQDVTVRGAVSIGRRLMDPLAELVKIDPKSIGVGQYQHDVDHAALKRSLDDVVMSCVNGVGVELNTASKQLLSYVSGLGPALAANIVAYRNENGPFKSRAELQKVPRLGPKAFEQAAGFLRIRDGAHPLDASAVHPESYRHRGRDGEGSWTARVSDLLRDAGAAPEDPDRSNTSPTRWACRRCMTSLPSLPSPAAIRASNSRCSPSRKAWRRWKTSSPG